MRKLVIASLCTLVFSAPVLSADNYKIDPSHTYPYFDVSHMGFSIQKGRFNKTTGTLVLDRAAKTGSVEITVETASIDTGFAQRDDDLRSDKFFNVEKFPTMTFKADELKFDGDVPVAAVGQLTLLGVTKPMTLAIENVKCGVAMRKEKCGAEVSGSLKRSDFGMTAFLPTADRMGVGDDINLHIAVEAIKE
jgi:polyisoprenoid-binding protein YceI